ncbi:hypothetical protein J6590_036212 [Homalodisca vitripennis]|nr:hypothetical protein J6590_036212 [Homalodisca vitripennis]
MRPRMRREGRSGGCILGPGAVSCLVTVGTLFYSSTVYRGAPYKLKQRDYNVYRLRVVF